MWPAAVAMLAGCGPGLSKPAAPSQPALIEPAMIPQVMIDRLVPDEHIAVYAGRFVCSPEAAVIGRPAPVMGFPDESGRPGRVAQAGGSTPFLNARMTVRCRRGAQVLRKWSGAAQWQGDLPASMAGEIRDGAIKWAYGREGECAIRVDKSDKHPQGRSLVEFCGPEADLVEIVVFAETGGTGDGPDGLGTPGKRRSKG